MTEIELQVAEYAAMRFLEKTAATPYTDVIPGAQYQAQFPASSIKPNRDTYQRQGDAHRAEQAKQNLAIRLKQYAATPVVTQISGRTDPVRHKVDGVNHGYRAKPSDRPSYTKRVAISGRTDPVVGKVPTGRANWTPKSPISIPASSTTGRPRSLRVAGPSTRGTSLRSTETTLGGTRGTTALNNPRTQRRGLSIGS